MNNAYDPPFHTHTHTYALVLAQQNLAGQVLTEFKENPDSWVQVDAILEFSTNPKTKVGPAHPQREGRREGVVWWSCGIFGCCPNK